MSFFKYVKTKAFIEDFFRLAINEFYLRFIFTKI